jgi:hypothetical protein
MGMMDPNEMTPFDRDILRHLNGEEMPGLSWGAAMGAAVEWLQGMGYATRGGNVQITDAGREALTKSESK